MELTLDKEMIHPMIITYEEQIRKDKEMATRIMARVRKFSEMVNKLRYEEIQLKEPSETRPVVVEDTEYSNKWSMSQKIKFMLRQAGKPTSTRDLTDLLISTDKNLSKDRAAALKTVSTLLSIGNGTDYRRIKEEGTYYYSLS